MKLFFFPSHKNMSEMKLKKLAYCNSLPHFFLPSMQKVVGEVILSNIFFQNSLALFRKLLMKLFYKKIALLVKLSCAKQSLIIWDYNLGLRV